MMNRVFVFSLLPHWSALIVKFKVSMISGEQDLEAGRKKWKQIL